MREIKIAIMKARYLNPNPAAVSALAEVRRQIESEFSQLESEQPRMLRLALNEAEAVAEETGFPELLFPALAAEKAQAVASWLQKQKCIRAPAYSIAFAA